MKKSLFFLSIAFSFFALTSANAQFLQFGLRAGASSSSLVSDDFSFSKDGFTTGIDIKDGSAKVGIHGGVFARIKVPLVGLYVQPEALLTSAGGEYTVTENGVSKNAEVSFTRFDFPILVGYKIGPLRLNADPIGSIKLGEDNGLADALKEVATADAKQEFKGATWGYQAGLGLDIAKKVAIDVKYEGNFSKFGDSVTLFGDQRNFDSRAQQVILSLGYFF